MKFKCPFFILSILLSVSIKAAENVSINQKNDGSIELQSENCDTIKKQINAILKWKEKFPEEQNFNQNVKFENTGTGCIADITAILPKFARDWHGKDGKNDGPNCWNTALYMSGVVDVIRFTNDREFNFWMNSPLCTELEKDAPVLPGDLIVERGESGEQHVSVAISDEILFEKIGFEKSLQYQLTTTPEMTPEQSEAGGKFCGRVKGQRPKECNLGWYNYYRCQSINEYIKNNPKTTPPEFVQYNQSMDQIECNLQNQIKSSGSASMDSFAETNLAIVQNLAAAESKKSPDNFFWKSLIHRADSLRSQIKITQKARK